MIARHRDILHKIGVTGGDVARRLANSKLDPTFLMSTLSGLRSAATFRSLPYVTEGYPVGTRSKTVIGARSMAQNSELSALKHRRGPGRQFARGVSGNPGGRPRAALDVRDLARQHTTKAIDTLVRALDDEKLCVSAAVHLLERGWGRPIAASDPYETEDRDTTFVLRIVSAQGQSVDGSDIHPPGVITIPAGGE